MKHSNVIDGDTLITLPLKMVAIIITATAGVIYAFSVIMFSIQDLQKDYNLFKEQLVIVNNKIDRTDNFSRKEFADIKRSIKDITFLRSSEIETLENYVVKCLDKDDSLSFKDDLGVNKQNILSHYISTWI